MKEFDLHDLHYNFNWRESLDGQRRNRISMAINKESPPMFFRRTDFLEIQHFTKASDKCRKIGKTVLKKLNSDTN